MQHVFTVIGSVTCALLVGGCALDALPQSWQLDRLRVLGVRASPAEPRPGESVTFESLVYTPRDANLAGIVWFACLPDNANDFGCAPSEDTLALLTADVDALSLEEQAALYEAAVADGFVGFEPFLPPVWTAPADALAGLEPNEREEGVSAVVNLTALLGDLDEPSTEDRPTESVELAYKRVPISEAVTPNHNPSVAGLEVFADPQFKQGTFTRGTRLSTDDQPLRLRRGERYQLQPILADSAVESYSFLNAEGQRESRTEEPYVTWYTEGGRFDQQFSLFPYTSTTWNAPNTAFEGLIVAVVRDRRGGMGWASLEVRVP